MVDNMFRIIQDMEGWSQAWTDNYCSLMASSDLMDSSSNLASRSSASTISTSRGNVNIAAIPVN